MFYEIYEQDIHIGVNLKKLPKFTDATTHSGKNKQNVLLDLAEFHEIISAVIKCYYSERLDVANLYLHFIK